RYGWNEMPYLDQGEFYCEFGNFEVSITLPKTYKVAATGTLQSEEKNDTTKTLLYKESNIHDFAWFADKNFQVKHDTIQLKNKTVDAYVYYYKENEKKWQNSLEYVKSAITTKSNWLGEYPYSIVTVVEKPVKESNGMEYPTITLITTPNNNKELDLIINHEVGHNWFYGILASNERKHPWMDEGMNNYYDNRYLELKKSMKNTTDDSMPSFLPKLLPADFNKTILNSLIAQKKDQPINTPSENFTEMNYSLISYDKTAQWLQLLEHKIGPSSFDTLMRRYYEKWKFKHPYPEDFKNIVDEVTGNNNEELFSLLDKKGSLLPKEKKSFKIVPFISLYNTEKTNYLFVAPSFGYNQYDKGMLGISLHNYTLPARRFQYFLSPLYAVGSKKLKGLGSISYSIFPGESGQKIELTLAGAAFTADKFTDPSGKENLLEFTKIVPSVKYVLANKNPRSAVTKYIQWKTFLISEKSLNFYRDPLTNEDIITYPTSKRYLNQLRFVIENNRLLYPYKAIFEAQQSNQFMRLNFTTDYFFNYPKSGGLSMRVFAGKFLYTGTKTISSQFATDRYHLNMSGANGYEDYTYSNYFIGRNEFQGALSQQMMIRDGGFKVRTDLLSSKIGKTDSWLTAVNLTSTIPDKFNPLSLLPIKLPLKLFADIGTYGDVWKSNATETKFLYDAGIQLSLVENTVNIYFPLLYSKVYADYFNSTITGNKFIKNISFSIDIQNFSLKKLIPEIPL
ncbi:MAG: M1 family metallopeptidase, partial [Ferruginibacter sp.]|nr:M1 family metallopeptidase [Ferruginibacter sp.]